MHILMVHQILVRRQLLSAPLHWANIFLMEPQLFFGAKFHQAALNVTRMLYLWFSGPFSSWSLDPRSCFCSSILDVCFINALFASGFSLTSLGTFGTCFLVLGLSLVLSPPSNLSSILTSSFSVPGHGSVQAEESPPGLALPWAYFCKSSCIV